MKIFGHALYFSEDMLLPPSHTYFLIAFKETIWAKGGRQLPAKPPLATPLFVPGKFPLRTRNLRQKYPLSSRIKNNIFGPTCPAIEAETSFPENYGISGTLKTIQQKSQSPSENSWCHPCPPQMKLEYKLKWEHLQLAWFRSLTCAAVAAYVTMRHFDCACKPTNSNPLMNQYHDLQHKTIPNTKFVYMHDCATCNSSIVESFPNRNFIRSLVSKLAQNAKRCVAVANKEAKMKTLLTVLASAF